MRRLLVWAHRWIGLAMAGILVIVALTGAFMAFIAEIDRFLNPKIWEVASRDAPLLDPLILREKAQGSDPRFVIDVVPLKIEPNAPVSYGVAVRTDPATGQPFELPITELYLDPYTGEKVTARSNLAVSVDKSNFVLFVHDLHTNLALSGSLREPAATLIGLTAVAWTIDCFIGFYLTLPTRGGNGDGRSQKSWLSRWKPSWLIRWRGGAFRLNFDIHRAFGLWTWIALFVLAWSGVALSLPNVYTPVMNAVFGAPPEAPPETPSTITPLTIDEMPKVGWREAYEKGHALLAARAGRDGFKIDHEDFLALARDQRRYRMCASGPGSGHEAPKLCVEVDADTGAAIEAKETKHTEKARVTIITEWLTQLHMAMLFRPAMQYVVCAMGFVIAALSLTGLCIWWKKRVARKQRRSSGAVIERPREATL